MRMGLREANQRFSRAIQAVKAGREVVLTERGEPIAVIRPLSRRLQARLQELEAAGLLRPPTRAGRMRPWRPRPIRGRPITITLREERTSR